MQSTRSTFWLFIPIAFAIRLIYAGYRELVPDEAFYWVLSRHLSTGYLDHPPMVAYIIKLGTLLCGSNELGVRCGAALLAFGALLVLLSMSHRVIGSERAAVWLGIIWLCSPLFAGLSTIMTPDTPAIFFSMCALACVVAISQQPVGSALWAVTFESDEPARSKVVHSADPTKIEQASLRGNLSLWLAFGLFTGLAMVSKYTAVLPAGAVVFALLTSTSGRRQFKMPGIWLAGLVAVLVFSPVIHWNATHQWASFKFQLHHGLDNSDSISEATGGQRAAIHLFSLGKYLIGQIGFFTPVFFVFGIVIVAIRWRHYTELSLTHRILLWSASLPLLFFGLSALKSGSPGEANWPAFGYFPMSLLLLDHIARQWKSSDLKWLRIGSGLALLITIVLHSPDTLYKAGFKDHFPRKLNEFFGWRQMARAVDQIRGDALVVAGTHQDAAELSFYLPGQPAVWVYPLTDTDGKPVSRPTALDYFPDRPDLSKRTRVLFFSGHVWDFARLYDFVSTDTMIDLHIPLHGRMRDRRFDLLVHR